MRKLDQSDFSYFEFCSYHITKFIRIFNKQRVSKSDLRNSTLTGDMRTFAGFFFFFRQEEDFIGFKPCDILPYEHDLVPCYLMKTSRANNDNFTYLSLLNTLCIKDILRSQKLRMSYRKRKKGTTPQFK